MFKFNYLWCLILGLSPILIKAKTEWIDPYSLEDDPVIGPDCPIAKESSQAIVTSHYTRTINLLLNSLINDDDTYKAHYSIELSQDDYNFMRTFLKGVMEDEKDWNRMDKIISTLFINTQDTLLYQILSWKDLLYVAFTSTESAVALGLIIVLWLLYNLRNINFKFLKIRYLAIVVFIIDFFCVWIYMLKEKELEQLLHIRYKVPPECDVKKMGWLQFIGHTLSATDACKEYHKIKNIDIIWTVTPFQVVGSQIGNIVLAPAEKIGKAFSYFINTFVSNSPWYLIIPTMLMVPVLLIVLMLGLCVILSFATGRTFSFNFFHLIQFSFGDNKSKPSQKEPIQPQQQPTTINVVMPRKKKRLRSTEQKKTPICDDSSQGSHLAVEEVQEDVVKKETDLSSQEESSTEEEYEVIS